MLGLGGLPSVTTFTIQINPESPKPVPQPEVREVNPLAKAIFDKYDTDRSGTLEWTEIRRCLLECFPFMTWPMNQCKQLLRCFDETGSSMPPKLLYKDWEVLFSFINVVRNDFEQIRTSSLTPGVVNGHKVRMYLDSSFPSIPEHCRELMVQSIMVRFLCWWPCFSFLTCPFSLKNLFYFDTFSPPLHLKHLTTVKPDPELYSGAVTDFSQMEIHFPSFLRLRSEMHLLDRTFNSRLGSSKIPHPDGRAVLTEDNLVNLYYYCRA